MSKFVDSTELDRIFKGLSLPSKNRVNTQKRVMRKAGNVIKDAVRSRLEKKFNTAGKPYEERAVNQIKRNIKVLNSKARDIARILIYAKGSTVSMGRGKTRREWSLNGALALILFGNYKKRPRKTRGSGKSRGNVDGIDKEGLYEPVIKSHGRQALVVAKKSLSIELEKEMRTLKLGL